MSHVPESEFNRLQTSYRSATGILTSRSIKSGKGAIFTRFSAIVPLFAILTMYVSLRILCANWISASASLTRRMIGLSKSVFSSFAHTSGSSTAGRLDFHTRAAFLTFAVTSTIRTLPLPFSSTAPRGQIAKSRRDADICSVRPTPPGEADPVKRDATFTVSPTHQTDIAPLRRSLPLQVQHECPISLAIHGHFE